MSGRAIVRRGARVMAALAGAVALAALGYAGSGYFSARTKAAMLAEHADSLIADGRGAAGLGHGRIDQLLMVEDPGFFGHSGIDLSTPGAGLTTLTQSLAKSVGFDQFKPGVRKIRLMGYALGLEHSLQKSQIIALWLDKVGMGRGPNGWMIGFYTASEQIYGRPPSQLTDPEFLTLVAVPIAPRNFDLQRGNEALFQRVSRIDRLVKGLCRPTALRDVWLEGCAH